MFSTPLPLLSPFTTNIQVITLDSLKITLVKLNAKTTVEEILAVIREDEEPERMDLSATLNLLLTPHPPADSLASKFPPVPPLWSELPSPLPIDPDAISTTPPPHDRDSPEFREFRRRRFRKIIQEMPKPWDKPSQRLDHFPPPVSVPNTVPVRTDCPFLPSTLTTYPYASGSTPECNSSSVQ